MNTIKKISLIAVCLLFICSAKCYAVSGKINNDAVRLRKEPSTNCETIELLYKNNEVEVSEKSGNFYKVTVRGYTGYVHQDYVSLNETLESETQTTQDEKNDDYNSSNNQESTTSETIQKSELKIGDIRTVNKDESIYIIPVINASKIKVVNTNSRLTVQQIINEWIYVSYEDGYGWIRKEKLIEIPTTPIVTTPEPSKEINKTAYIKYDGVNFREKPSLTADVIKSLYINTKITIKEEVDSKWYKIDVNGLSGYISKDLVSDTIVETTSRGSTTNSQRELVPSTQNNNTTEQTNLSEEQTTQTTTSNKGQQVAEMAKKYVGSRYVYGGSGPSTFDCSGLTMYIYKQFGISLPHSATAQSKYGREVSKFELQPGDLVVFSDYKTFTGIGHIGIYIGEGSFVHASTSTTGVIISSLNSDHYTKRYVTARRLFN